MADLIWLYVLNRTKYVHQCEFGNSQCLGQATQTIDAQSGNAVTWSGGPREMQSALQFLF